MRNVRTPFFMAGVLFLLACPALGTIEFKDGLTHNINYHIGADVWVDYGAPYIYTTVNLLAGGRINYPYKLCGYENSRINVRGGEIIGHLYGYNQSQINITEGSIGFLETMHLSQVNISGGSIDWFGSHSFTHITGGSIGGLHSMSSGQVYISGGSIGGFESSSFSQVDISGGSIEDHLYSNGFSKIDISGGSIGDLKLWDQSKIQIIGSDFAVDGQPFGYGELTSIFGGWPEDEPLRHLTGTLLSSELIDTDFRIGHDARIILVPEPGTLALLGIGILYLRRMK